MNSSKDIINYLPDPFQNLISLMAAKSDSVEWEQDRLGSLPPATLEGEQKELYDDIVGYFEFPYSQSNSAILFAEMADISADSRSNSTMGD